MPAKLKSALAGLWVSRCAALRVTPEPAGPDHGFNETLDKLRFEAETSERVVELENLTFAENITAVSGMFEVREAELQGYTPQLVDAFFDATGSNAFVIFNTNLMVPHHLYDKYNEAFWSCEWSWASDNEPFFLSRPVSWGEIVTDPSKEASQWLLSQEGGDPDVEEESAARSTIDARRRDSGEAPGGDGGLPSLAGWDPHRHSFVLRCPVPSFGKPSTSLRVTVIQDQHVYHYSNVNVSNSSLLQPSNTAVCTMMINDTVARPYLPEWVAYHLSIGFDQILIYIEDLDPTWASELLSDFLQQGRVRLVHFYFSNVSSERHFRMQQAQEQHCLYQAKGRVKWLAHVDVDEYFQLMGPWQRVGDFLSNRSGDFTMAAYNVRSQFWYAGNYSYQARMPLQCLPCDMMCKPNDYYVAEHRSKLILGVENVVYFSVHMLTASKGKMIIPSPGSEIRLNHFKSMPDGLETKCVRDTSFVLQCRNVLHAANLSGNRSSRCSPEKMPEEDYRFPIEKWLSDVVKSAKHAKAEEIARQAANTTSTPAPVPAPDQFKQYQEKVRRKALANTTASTTRATVAHGGLNKTKFQEWLAKAMHDSTARRKRKRPKRSRT